MEKIWRVKRKICQRTIYQIKTNPLDKEQATAQDHISSMFQGNNRLCIDYDYQQDQVSILELLRPIMRTIIENCQKNIKQCTQQIIAFKNTSPTQ